jgi:hypothetical protein
VKGLNGKSGQAILLLTLLVGAMALPLGVAAQADEGPIAAASADAPPSDADLASSKCAIGEERFLPGDYYYCLAAQSYGQKRYGYAHKFFTTAASWASKPAQYVLGIMALDGDHQPVNRPQALAWLALASERPGSDFKGAYDAAYASATPAERQAAEKLLTQMRPIYGDATAAVRAEKRYAHGMAVLSQMDKGGAKYCLEGLITPADLPPSDPSTCPPAPLVESAIDRTASKVFEGWSGHVSVEPLQQVAAPAGTNPGEK